MTPQLARRIFFWAAVYGVIVILPQYFLEQRIGLDYPPAITHPEHFYGFLGTALAWQIAFFIIAGDVVRYRLLMLPAALEKILFALSVFALYFQGRVPPLTLGFASLDLGLAALFLWSYFALGRAASRRA